MRQRTFNRAVLLHSLVLLLASCGKDTAKNSKVHGTVLSPSLGAALIGGGYDSKKDFFTANCVASGAEPKILYAGEQSSSLRFQQSMSFEEMKDLLDVQVKGRLNYGTFNITAAAKFASEAAATDLSRSLIFASVTRGKSAILNNPTLTQVGLDAANTLDKDVIHDTCGDEFIHQVDLGAQLLVNVKFEFSSKEVKSNFEAEIDLNYLSLFDVKGAAKVASERYQKNVAVYITAYQVGGSPQRLPTIFHGQGGAVEVVKCGFDDPENCNKALESIVQYATGDFTQQVENLSYNPTVSGGAAVLGYQTRSYYNAGLRKLYPSPSPVLGAEIAAARERLAARYETQSRDRGRATKLLEMRLTADERATIMQTDDILKRNVTKIVNTSQTCYDSPNLCVATEEAMMLENYDPATLSKLPIFYDYCVMRGSTTAIKSTVAAIKDLLRAGDDADCEDIEADLINEQVLDLKDKRISDLRPLRKLNNLKSLDLSDNFITNVTPLSTLPNLETLNLRRNSISNLSALQSQTRLKSLDLAYNRVIDVEPLRALKNLHTLKLQGDRNQVVDWSPTDSLPGLKVYYKSLEDICEQERSYVRKAGLVSPSDYALYKSLGFGPLYNRPQDRSTGVSEWANCIILEDYY
jgi:Leucine-rich repeat (LRR) protein